MGDAWVTLETAEYETVWHRFTTAFAFRPGIHAADWPGIREPVPSLTFDISAAYGADDTQYDKLHRQLLNAFQELVGGDEFLYALDWQHDCYRFYPHRSPSVQDWPIPLIPNGDYYIFVAPDLQWGTFGHPWEETLCLFGGSLLALLDDGTVPLPLLAHLLRRDGA